MCEASRNTKRQKIRVSQSCADPSVQHGKVQRNSVAVGDAPCRASAADRGRVPAGREASPKRAADVSAAGDFSFLTRAAAASVPAMAAARTHLAPTVIEVTPVAT
ncbi:hypothetical protein HOK021_72350 [Streptomyces hygroscopicus]|nr:hypothetical protein HOK021_72350 [Streptomyces hygroscopicus]